MATTQLMPPYNYPEVWSFFTDNSAVTDTNAVTSDNTIGYLFAFTCSKGPDNEIVKVTSENERYNLFGPTNYKLYGQPYMMVSQALKVGKGKTFVNCIRVLPDDATYAYSILQCYYKADADKKKFFIKYNLQEITSEAKTDEEFKAIVDSTQTGAGAGDGWKVVNFLGVRANGRGKFGNTYRWRVAQDIRAERNYGIKYYNFNIVDTANGSSTLIGSIYGSAAYASSVIPTVFINDKIVESTEPGKFPAIIYVNESAVEAVYDEYVTFLKNVIIPENPTVTIPDISKVDYFFGNKIGSIDSDEYIIVQQKRTEGIEDEPGYDADRYADGEAITLNDAKGFALSGGSDGAFDNEDPEARQRAINQCYIKAYSGVYEKCKPVLSGLRTPTTALFDANYDFEVKQVLRDLANLRNCSILYLDTGINTSFSEGNLDNLIMDYQTFVSDEIIQQATILPNVSINTQWYLVRESDTGRRVPVTHTYYIISKLGPHFVQNGFHVPFAQAAAQLSDHIANSLQPCIDVWEYDLQEKLNENRINYFIATGENQFRRATQNIAQYPTSDLIEESHVHIAYYLANNIGADARNRLYNFADADERSRFTSFVERKYAGIVGTMVESFSVRFDVTEWEAQRHIVHGYIDITFRQLSKQFILEFNINSRTISDTTATTTTL